MAHESNNIPLTSSFVSLVHLVDSVTSDNIPLSDDGCDDVDEESVGDNGKTVHRKK